MKAADTPTRPAPRGSCRSNSHLQGFFNPLKQPFAGCRPFLLERMRSPPSVGSRWPRFPAFSGTIRALRLPALACPSACCFRRPVPRAPAGFVSAMIRSRRKAALPQGHRLRETTDGSPRKGTKPGLRGRKRTQSQALCRYANPKNFRHSSDWTRESASLPYFGLPGIRTSGL